VSLAALAGSATLLASRDEESLLRRIRWTPPQMDFLRAVSPLPVLLRTGNQWLGKTTVAAADVLHRCQGDHPFDPRGQLVPCRARVISPTDEHSIQIQEKVWELADKSTLVPGQVFIEGKGMKGRYALIKFRNGSRIDFRTSNQGALALSGGTIDHVLIDELCPPRIFNEAKKRVSRRNGTVRMAVTPINAPADWLRKEVEAGRILDLHYRCEARWCIPVGATEPLRDPKTGIPMDQAWIDKFIADSDPLEVDVVVHGGWQIVHVDRSFGAWSDNLVLPQDPSVPELLDLATSIDYGEQAGKFVAHLSIQTVAREVWVLGEWLGTGREGVEEAAAGIVAMLASWGLTPHSIQRWVGDTNSGGVFAGGVKLNEMLQREINKTLPRVEIQPAFKQRGSVDTRFAMLNAAMAARKLRIHPSCGRLLEAVRQHRKGASNAADLKDPIDALWYGVEPWIREVAPLPARVRIG